MKFTPSSSVSSSSVSSTSSSSFTDNFYKTKGTTFGCFSAVLSRILCSKNLPTHPTNPIEIINHKKFSKIVLDDSNTPNVVARLMGLNSMPEISSKSSQKMSNSISKTKSMGAEEFREETEEIQLQHRRVKTSVSFRETPEFFELQDDDFFVLSFENGGKSKKKGSNFGNCEVGIRGKRHRKRRQKCGRKQRRNRHEQCKDHNNRVFSDEERLTLKISPQNLPKMDAIFDIHKQSYHLSPLKDRFCSNSKISDRIDSKKKELDGIKARKKKREENFYGECKDEMECDSDNSSPVSVLDHITDFISDHEVTTSEEDARLGVTESVSRSYTCQSSESDKEHEREACGNEDRNVRLKRRDYKKHENIDMLKRICKLAEAEVKNSNWKYRRMLSDDELEDTAKDFGQRIFDQLVSELIDQLLT